jgi:hypothetical protein
MQLCDGRVLATTPSTRRQLARSELELSRGSELLAFAQPDNHLHAIAPADEGTSHELARRIEISLSQILALPVRFAPAHCEPIHSQRHLSRAFRYVLSQNAHHGIDNDPLHESTNLPDLLGLRLTDRYTFPNVRRYLPRIRRAQLLEWIGAPTLEPSDLPIDQVMDAALSASCLCHLRGSRPEVVATRRVIAKIVGRRIPANDLAALLGVSSRTAFRLLRSRPDPSLEQAIRLQLGLRKYLCEQSQ